MAIVNNYQPGKSLFGVSVADQAYYLQMEMNRQLAMKQDEAWRAQEYALKYPEHYTRETSVPGVRYYEEGAMFATPYIPTTSAKKPNKVLLLCR